MNNKKSIFIILLIITSSLLMGAKFFDVELKGADKPLVDLGSIIETGGSFVPASDTVQKGEPQEDEAENPDSKENEQAENDTDAESASEAPIERVLIIRISNTKVYIGNSTYTKSSYQGCLNSILKTADSIVLVDDYAEYHMYCEVRDYLTNANVEFTESMSE